MNHHSTDQNSAVQPLRMTASLLDGLITLAGVAVAMGGFFNREIVMWWLGA